VEALYDPPMDKLDRVRAALAGEAPDRPPYGFWTHLPGIDLDPGRLAHASADFFRRYDVDFAKSMPNGFYCVEDWGTVADYSEIERGGVAKVAVPGVRSAAGWRSLARVGVRRGAYGRELDHLRKLVALLGPGVPVLATVFSPLTVAAKLADGAHRAHLLEDPDGFRTGIDTIAEVTGAFARAAIEAGCAGVFLAAQDAVAGEASEAAYRAFGEPGDRRVLAAARAAGSWLDVVHMHGENVLFDILSGYDVAALNWHIGETPPSIAAYRASGGRRPIVGGLQRAHITRRDRAAIGADIESAMRETQGRGLLLSPACVIRHPVDEDTLLHTAAAIKALAGRRAT
jgi:uroporphyrinogen decarboxylase